MEISPPSSSATESILSSLTSRGWFFADLDKINALIRIQFSLHGDSCSVDYIESELSNMDLRSIGAKSLPDPSLLRKSPYLLGPKVLQISSSRDISRSMVDSAANSRNHKRLLRLKLTDGHSDITAVEFTHIPAISDDPVPGTKVRLENKAVIRGGIVCLNPESLTLLGGVVQSLHDEWKMNLKFSSFSRKSLKLAQESATGPPPFEKLQIRVPLHQYTQQDISSGYSSTTLRRLGSNHLEKSQHLEPRKTNKIHIVDSKPADVKSTTNTEKREENPSTSSQIEEKASSFEVRPKEVVEYIPVQNQAASQKLLQKMSQPSHSRGRKLKGRGRQEESSLLTLDEWEKRKVGMNIEMKEDRPDISQDGDLAWQLQKQFVLENLEGESCSDVTEAENIRRSMFSFERNNTGGDGRIGFRGRGRRRGRR